MTSYNPDVSFVFVFYPKASFRLLLLADVTTVFILCVLQHFTLRSVVSVRPGIRLCNVAHEVCTFKKKFFLFVFWLI